MAASVLIEKQKENKVNILLMKPKRRPESPFLRVHVRVCHSGQFLIYRNEDDPWFCRQGRRNAPSRCLSTRGRRQS